MLPLHKLHRGRCPRTPGIYRFGLIRIAGKKKQRETQKSFPPIRLRPPAALGSLPSVALSSAEAGDTITRVNGQGIRKQMCQLLIRT